MQSACVVHNGFVHLSKATYWDAEILLQKASVLQIGLATVALDLVGRSGKEYLEAPHKWPDFLYILQ